MSHVDHQHDDPIRLLLDPGGPIARRLPDFEVRPQQREMAGRVARALADDRCLWIEAGTGVGKSFAYLLPAVRRAVEHGERIVIATHTISLQEQLIDKDIPLLQAALPDEFTAVLVKGRGNYVSLRRLQLAAERAPRLFPDPAQVRALEVIEDWAMTTDDGSLATLPQIPRPDIWDRVQSDSDNCMGRNCPNFEPCFFQTARRRMERANLLVCNHALFFSDLALRVQGHGILPPYKHVILDEAHNIEEVAADHFGLSLTEGRVHHLLRTLYTHRAARSGRPVVRGYLPTLKLEDDDTTPIRAAIKAVEQTRHAAGRFFDDLVAEYAQRSRQPQSPAQSGTPWAARGGEPFGPSGSVRLHEPNIVANGLTPALMDLSLRLKLLKDRAAREADKFELNAYAERASSMAGEAEMLLAQRLNDCVYWLDVTARSDAAAFYTPAGTDPAAGGPGRSGAGGPAPADPSFFSDDEGDEEDETVEGGHDVDEAAAEEGDGDDPADSASERSGPGATAQGPSQARRAFDRAADHAFPGSGGQRSPADGTTSSAAGSGRGVFGPGRRSGDRARRRVTFSCSPVEVAPILRECLFNRSTGGATILTSATLATAAGNFNHIMSRCGCDAEQAETVVLGSPFNYAQQVRCIIESHLPEPGQPDYVRRVAPRVLHHVRETEGGAFVLFTSFRMLNQLADAVRGDLQRDGFPIFVHGRDGPAGALVQRFRESAHSVLFGTASFWQGVDVRGHHLRNVIITRLPFDVPDRPLTEARSERIRERGGNPFFDDSLPRAIIRFKQGFGRLIRSATDTGRFVVLDPRVATKPYGRQFIKALPPDLRVERIDAHDVRR